MAAKRLDLSTLAEAETPELTKRPPRAVGRLVVVPLKRMRANDVNPRKNFGDPEDLLALGKSIGRKQLQAVRAVSRGAYIALFPEFEERVPADVDVVIVNGERRFRAGGVAGLESLEVVIDDELAESRRGFLDAVMAENIDRQNFDPIEEAHGIEVLVQEFGSADAVATHFGRTKGWVSQRRSLLKLTDEIQDLVRTGEVPIRRARELASVPAGEQFAAWTASLVPAPAAPAAASSDQAQDSPSKSPRRKAAPRTQDPTALPWGDPNALADLIIDRVSREHLAVLVPFLSAELGRR